MLRNLTLLVSLVAVVSLATPAHAIVGLSLKLGGVFIPDGRKPGILVQAEVGPLSPFAEFYKKSGISTFNSGANFVLRSPSPLLSPYAGAGAGLSRSSGLGTSSTKAMANVLVGADVKLPGTVSFFGQAKYIYTFGTSTLKVREFAIQAGLRFYFGI
jgi:hypothetical protein